MAIAAVLFVGLSFVRTGHFVSQGLSSFMWRDLALSGLIGFAWADLMLFQAVALIGARLTMLIYASVPALAAVAGYCFMGESIGPRGLVGMAITGAGICLAVLGKPQGRPDVRTSRTAGIALALGGSIGQAAGLLLGKHGAAQMDAFAATEVRVLAGLIGFLVIMVLWRNTSLVVGTLRAAAGLRTAHVAEVTLRQTRVAMLSLTLGGLMGPFLGVSLGLLSTQLLPTGIASTLMSLVPVLIIPVSVVAFQERVTALEIGGTVIALVGVGLLTI